LLSLGLGTPLHASDETRLEWLLAFLGVSATSGLQKTTGEDISGNIFLARLTPAGTLASPIRQKITTGGDWRWPVFSTDGRTILALRGQELVQLAASNGRELGSWPSPPEGRFSKIVGAHASDPDLLLVLLETPAGTRAASFALSTGAVRIAAMDLKDEMIARLTQSTRVYGERVVRTAGHSGGEAARTDVSLQIAPDKPDIIISSCPAQKACDHGSLSPNGERLLYVQHEP
jgi:hypothetical protein